MKRCASIISLVILLLTPAAASYAQEALPPDVSPETRSRLPVVKPANSEEHGQNGRFALAGVPKVAQAMRLHGYPGGVVQAENPLNLAFMQLPFLATARENDQPLEWSLHEMVGVAEGLNPAVINVVRYNRPIKGLPEKDAMVIKMARELFGKNELSSTTYAEALKVFGQQDLINIIGLMADYSATSVSLSAFNQQMPPGWPQFLPLPFKMPGDIHSDSRSRLPLITDRIPPEPAFAKPLYGRNPTPVGTGPAYIGMHGHGYASLKANVGMPTIDLAILVTAREHNSEYDWAMNELTAEKDGLDSKVIEVVRDRKPTTGLDEKDAAVIDFGRELLQKHFVTAETYARAEKSLGQANLVDLVSVMGQHTREAALLAAFDQQLPEGQEPLLPLPKTGDSE